MSKINEILSVLAVFAYGYFILFFFLWIVNRKRLFNFWGVLVASFGAGLGFGFTAFLGTYIDEKSQTWGLAQRLSSGAEVFVWAFIGSIITIPLAIEMVKAKKH